jgi:hypothetical protein
MGPRASEPLKAAGKLCLLVSCPVHDLVRKVAGNAVPKGQPRAPPSLSSLGCVFLRLGQGLSRSAGIDWELLGSGKPSSLM